MSQSSKPLTVDPLSGVLSLLRPTTYGFRGLDAGGKWSIAYPADPGIKCYAIQAGSCFLCVDEGATPLQLAAGDFVLLPGGPGFRLCSSPSISPIDAAAFMTGAGVGTFAVLNGGGSCSGVGGYFSFEGLHGNLLLDLLPPVIHITAEASKTELRGMIERTMRELRAPLPGGSLLVEHLTQSLLIEALRLHITERSQEQIGWLFALADRQLSAVITAIHHRPGHKWTLTSLAKIAAMSRSSFAARFRAAVGEPPMEYLTRWRMMLAVEKLVREAAPISLVAPALGYQSESAFGAAFKRIVGFPPRQFVKSHQALRGAQILGSSD